MQKATRILIVDDSTSIRKLVRSYLELQGLEVHEAGNGPDAVEMASGLHPDVIVLDFSMPGMNGLEAAASIRTLLPKTPIILFTMHKDVLPKDDLPREVSAVLSKTEGIDLLYQEVELLADAKRG
jgi:CheY-like chemotaxis protein